MLESDSLPRRSPGFRAGYLVAALLGVALALRLALFGIAAMNLPAGDDESIVALQAKQISRGEFPLLFLASPYGFPLEAYLMFPLIHVLPRTAFGARAMAFGFGLLSLVFGWLILRRWGSLRDTWPGVLLLFFGSAFMLIFQTGDALPNYPTLILLPNLVLWMAQAQADQERRPWILALAAGFVTGLVCSETLLAAPVLLMVGAMMGLHRRWSAARWSLPAFAMGAGAGLFPYVLAGHLYPGAHEAVVQIENWRSALKGFFNPILQGTLPAALGIGTPIIPGSATRIDAFRSWDTGFGFVWLGLLAVASVVALAVGWSRWRRERWPSLDAGLVTAGIAWLSLALFLLSTRSHSRTYRYLILSVWSLPFLVAYLYCHARGFWRLVVGTVAVAFLVANVANTAGLAKRWADPNIATELKYYDLQPAIRYLDQRGIRHAVATYVDAYRLTFETDERILCSQPFNERFPGWPVPYKEEAVDPSTNVAFVLSDTYRFPPSLLERDLAAMQVAYRKTACGRYDVYTDFVARSPAAGPVVPERFPVVAASHQSEVAAHMADGTPTYWRSRDAQSTGMWVRVEWETPRVVEEILMDHGVCWGERAERVFVHVLENGAWQRLEASIPNTSRPFEFLNGHPVYGRASSRVKLPNPVTVRGLKLEIAEARKRRRWAISEIGLLPPVMTEPAKP